MDLWFDAFNQLTRSLCTAHAVTSRQHPVVPAERRPTTCPVATVGQYKPRVRLAGCWVLQPHGTHRAQRNKSRQRGRLYSPFSTKARGKERTFPAPTPPLTCIFPTTSIITTNRYNKRQIETLLCSHDDQIYKSQKEISHSEDPEEKLKSTLLHEHQLTLSMSRTHTAPAAEEGQCCEVRAAHLSTADTKRSSSCRLWWCYWYISSALFYFIFLFPALFPGFWKWLLQHYFLVSKLLIM